MRELLPKLHISTTYHATRAQSLSGKLQAIHTLLKEEEAGDEEASSDRYDKLSPSYGKRAPYDIMVELVREGEIKLFREIIKWLGEKQLASLVAHRDLVSCNSSFVNDSFAHKIYAYNTALL